MHRDSSWYQPAGEYLKMYRQSMGEEAVLTEDEQDKIQHLASLNQL